MGLLLWARLGSSMGSSIGSPLGSFHGMWGRVGPRGFGAGLTLLPLGGPLALVKTVDGFEHKPSAFPPCSSGSLQLKPIAIGKTPKRGFWLLSGLQRPACSPVIHHPCRLRHCVN